MANIYDVAKAANVSISTVSYVFNGKRPISEEVKAHVLETASALGYAGGRKKGSKPQANQLIGLFGSSIENLGYNIYTHQTLMGIFNVLKNTDYHVLFIPDGSNASSIWEQDTALCLQLAGAVVIEPKETENYYSYFEEKKIPIVVIGRPEAHNLSTNYVDVDNVSLGYRSMKYFLDRKISEVLFLNGPKGLTVSEDRKKGVLLALEEYGLPAEKSMIVHTDFSLDRAYDAVREIYSGSCAFPAVIACSDLQVIGALNAIRDCGYDCPRDVSLFCTSETYMSANATPRITGMDTKPVQIGEQTANLLLKLIRKELINPSHISLPSELHERDSVRS